MSISPNEVEQKKMVAQEYKGPKGYPIVGVIPEIGGNFLAYVAKVWREYGDHFCLRLGAQTMYFVVHPDDVKHVLQTNHRNYEKPYEQLKDFLGEGLVTADGGLWRRQRRLIQPMFLYKKMESYVEAMLEGGLGLLERWSGFSAGQEIDAAGEMIRVTQQVIAKAMFSDALERDTDRLCRALDTTMKCLDQRMFVPDFAKQWPLPINRRYKSSIAVVAEAMNALIDEHLREPERFDDLLSLLLHTTDEETGEKMSRQQVIDEVTTIFFAGHETTANTLSWAWYLLSLHPDVAEKMYEEIDRVLEGRIPTMKDVEGLSYTNQVFEETLRLFPVAWIFQRRAIEEDILPSGYRIPKGSLTTLAPYLTHRHPEFWENPEGFQPQRFTKEAIRKQHHSAYYPFSSGQRVCLGISFSQLEGPLLLALIAQRYRLSLAPGVQIAIKPMGTLRPNPSLPMQLFPRTDGPAVEELSLERIKKIFSKDAELRCPMHGGNV